MNRKTARAGRLAISAALAALVLGVGAGSLQFSSAAKADTDALCSDTVTSPPTGPATVSSAATSDYGTVLVVGSGDYKGCSLYLLTSDQLHKLVGSQYACSDAPNAIGATAACDTFLWPALLTDGAPIAGPGVNKRLLGTVTRDDLPGLPTVQQVTYAGQPLYRFFLDEDVGESEGANLLDPVTSPAGIWYLVNPRGTPATGPAELQLETASVGRKGSDETVLAATMDQDFSLYTDKPFPVYTLSPDRWRGFGQSSCDALCEQYWPPVLTSGWPQAGAGVNARFIGVIWRQDGSEQVTYKGRPLYLSTADAIIPALPYNGAAPSINGAGADTVWGTFNTIPPLP